MPDELPEIPENKHITVLLYKSKDGSLKELRVVQPLDPGLRTLSFADLRILAGEVSKILRQDAF